MSVIERIEVSAVGPDVALQGWASDLPPQHATLTIVRVFDEDGTEGVGGTPSYSTGQFDLAVLESLRLIAPRVIGADPRLREAIWHELEDLTLPRCPAHARRSTSRSGISSRGARGCRSTSCSAARARACPRTPRRRCSRTRRRTSSSSASVRAQGFRAVKFHAWCEPDRDLEMLRAVHAAHGDAGLAFMHDAEQRYDHHGALRVGRELDAMGFAWLEAPFPTSTSTATASCAPGRGPDPARRQHDPRHPAGRARAAAAAVGCRALRRGRRRRLHGRAKARRPGRGMGPAGSSCRAGATR